MRDYGKVHTSFWSSKTLRGLDSDAKVLALYLLTSPHTHMAGVFRLPAAYACEDLGWVAERLENGFKTLSDAGWLRRCSQTCWVWIINFAKFNPPDNPNQAKAVAKQIALVPADCSFGNELRGDSEPLSNGSCNPPIPTPTLSLALDKSKAKARKTLMPADFAVSARVAAWGKEKGFDRLAEHLDAFRRKCAMNGYTYANWDDAFMEAVREDWAKLRGGGRGPAPAASPTGPRRREL